MRVGFDAKRFFANFTGLGNYSRFVVSALSNQYPDDSFVLFSPKSNDQHPELKPLLTRPNVTTIYPQGAYRYMKSLWRSYGMSVHPMMRSLDIFHGLSQELPFGLKGVRKVVTVHDLIFLRFPQFYNPIDVAIYKTKVKAACASADIVIAISQQTADDLKTFFSVAEQKVRVVYQGCHPNFKREIGADERTAIREMYGLPDEYILSVGTIEERKNVKIAVEAMGMMPASRRIPLVIVGKRTAYIEQVKQHAIRHGVIDNLVFIHNARFEDLPGIYQMATIFVYPSLFEGFGIPIVEAIESGLPVITSKGSCFSEAGGPSTLYFDPSNAEELVAHLTTILDDQAFRAEVVSKSRKYISRFTPERIASDLVRVYNDVLTF